MSKEPPFIKTSYVPVKKPIRFNTRRAVQIAAVVFGGMLLFLANSGPSDNRPDSRVPTGGIGYLRMGRSKIVLLASNSAALGQMQSMLAADNQEGVAQLMESGRVFAVPSNTRATVIEKGFQVHRVRILDGEERGREGRIEHEFIFRSAK